VRSFLPNQELLRTGRDKQLVATFLSVSEFNPDQNLDILNELSGVQQREVMLMKNVIFRKAPENEPKDSSEQNVSEPTKIKFNLHKTVTGFLTAASEVADIYCAKTQITEALYDELNARMLTFYSMLCDQIGWAKGIENDCIISGFSLPSWQDNEGPRYKYSSWTFGQNIRRETREAFRASYEELIKSVTDKEKQYKGNNCHDIAALAPEKLVNTNIHRLEIRDNPNPNCSSGYIDRNFAVPQLENRGIIQPKEVQVRYRVRLKKTASELLKEMHDSGKYTYFNKGDEHIDEFHLDLVNKVLVTSLLSFDISREIRNQSSQSSHKDLSYCLFSRYSGSAKKSAVFYLLSSTEDLPFLQALRSFGRIANTAANNMLSRLAAQKAAKRAARTAVFARNFSHITGSHVISNPDFRNSLAGANLIYSLKSRLDQSYNDFIKAENNLLARLHHQYNPEQLWANGTKALEDARDKLGTGDVFLDNTRRFHEYLQGRFDFIARAIDDTKDLPEPVWFVQDLLRGFFNQTCYLDNLVADLGLRLENMEFYLIIEPNELVQVGDGESQQQTNCDPLKPKFVARWKPVPPRTDPLPSGFEAGPLEIDWEPDTRSEETRRQDYRSIQSCDKLVSLPGGMIAAHAFYSILENIIRNSAKYGNLKINHQDPNSKYRLTISLLRDRGNYRARIWDNYSSAESIEEKKLLQKLQKPFVTSSGVSETENLGLIEMQACAQLLCRPDENGGYPVPLELKEKVKPEFNLWIVAQDESSKSIKGANPESGELLAYELSFAMPTLLGCYTHENFDAHTSQSVRWSKNLEELIKQSPFLLVIDGDRLEREDKIHSYMEGKNYPKSQGNPSQKNSLPHRTIALYSKERPSIENSIFETSRVKMHSCAELYNQIFTAGNKGEHLELVLKVYNAWLMQWKSPPGGGPWHLWIGLERQKMQVQEAWEHAPMILQCDDQFGKYVRLMVKSHSSGDDVFASDSIAQSYKENGQTKNDDQTPSAYWEKEREASNKDKKALLFDNHGNCFPEAYGIEKARCLAGSTRFYQKLSGSVSPDLFQMLSRPPTDPFSFRFFLYSLVEACLTNVVVVDERLAWSLVDGDDVGNANRNFAQDLLDHQKAGIFPIFRFRQHGASESSGFYSSVHKERLTRSMQSMLEDTDHVQQSVKDLLNHEGIIYASENSCENSASSQLRLITLAENRESGLRFILAQPQLEIITSDKSNCDAPSNQGNVSIQADVLLIHEGAMDILASQKDVDWSQYQQKLQALYKVAPVIVRTSGRGRKSQLLGEDLPFIEFGQVSSSLLTARNKFSLVRGLLGSVGSAPKNQTI
jgi:hypothetical protein